MLTQHGEFFPYAMSMKPSGEIVSVAYYDGREQPPSQEMIGMLRDVLVADARAEKVKATAVVYDVRIRDPRTGQKTDAIAVALDHRDHYSVVVMFPYSLLDGKLTVGDPIAEIGQKAIFPRQSV